MNDNAEEVGLLAASPAVVTDVDKRAQEKEGSGCNCVNDDCSKPESLDNVSRSKPVESNVDKGVKAREGDLHFDRVQQWRAGRHPDSVTHNMSHLTCVPFIEAKIKQRSVLLISKSNDPICHKIEDILKSYQLNRFGKHFEILDISKRQDAGLIDTYLYARQVYTHRQVPHLFVHGKHVGGEKEIMELHNADKLMPIFDKAKILSPSKEE